METADKKIAKLFRKLGRLKDIAEEYQTYLVKSKNYLSLGDPDGFWLKQAQRLVNEIDLMVFVELWELIKKHTLPEDNFGGYVVPARTFTVNLSKDIKYAINSRKPEKVDALIQQLKKVQSRHHVQDEPDKTEILTVDKLIDKSKPKNASMWERLTEYGRGHVNAALDNAAKHYGCNRKDLVWDIDSGGAIHIKKKSQALLEQKIKQGLEQLKSYRDKQLASAYKSLCVGEKQFLSGIAKDVAMLVVKPKKMDYFRKQLREFGEKWEAYRKAHQADRKGKWQPSMGKPSNPLGTIWPAAYGSGWEDDIARERKPSYGVHVVPPPCVAYPPMLVAYVILSVIHDNIPSHCPSITREILPKELAREIWRNLVTGRLQEDGMERIPNRIIENCLRDVKANIESHFAPKKSTTQKLAASPDLASKQPAEQMPTEASGDRAGDTKKPAKEPSKDTPITLREFMKEYCEPLTDNLRESRVRSLQGLHQRNKIELTRIDADKPRQQGKGYAYLPSYLIKMWPSYQKELQTLPNLIQTESQI